MTNNSSLISQKHALCMYMITSCRLVQKMAQYTVTVLMIRIYHTNTSHDDVIKLKHLPRYWPFVRWIHRSPVNSPHKGQWRGALMFSLICVWINGWVNNREAGDLKRYRAHCDVTAMHLIRSATCTMLLSAITTSLLKALHWSLVFMPWASYQIRKIAGCANAGNAGNVFPVTAS